MQEQTHITLSIEQFNLLLGEIRDLKNEILDLKENIDLLRTDTSIIKRTFTKAKSKEATKTKAERISTLSASILRRGKKIT